MTKESKEMMRTHYTRENFPVLVAHSYGWNIYAKDELNEDGEAYCAAIPTTPDRLPHAYGTTRHVARQIALGYLRPVRGNLHLANQ